jgi:DNA-binding protein H-NS
MAPSIVSQRGTNSCYSGTVAFIRQPAGQLGARIKSIQRRAKKMKDSDLRSMTVDELWLLHQQIASILVRKISDEKAQLDRRLQQISPIYDQTNSSGRRSYPRVHPKYRNPGNPGETWAGRGKQPHWLTAQLKAGKQLDDFRIRQSSERSRRSSL